MSLVVRLANAAKDSAAAVRQAYICIWYLIATCVFITFSFLQILFDVRLWRHVGKKRAGGGSAAVTSDCTYTHTNHERSDMISWPYLRSEPSRKIQTKRYLRTTTILQQANKSHLESGHRFYIITYTQYTRLRACLSFGGCVSIWRFPLFFTIISSFSSLCAYTYTTFAILYTIL